MPDFVLKALNQCLPSKEQEENVLSAPDPSFPNVLEVPLSPFVEPNHFHKQNNHIASRSLQEGKYSFNTGFKGVRSRCFPWVGRRVGRNGGGRGFLFNQGWHWR